MTRSQRRERRLRELVAVLVDYPQGLTWPEAWPLVTERVPLVPDDEQTGSSGQVVGENDVRYSLTSLDKTGWVLTGVGVMRVTATGRQALSDLPEDHDFWLAASRGYDEWKNWRDAARDEGPDTSDPRRRWPLETGESAMLRVSRGMLDRGLRSGGSAFSAHHRAWSGEVVGELHRAFVLAPDAGEGSFHEKFEKQLAGCSDDAVLLAAEILALTSLPLADLKPDTKRQQVKRVLSLMAEPVAIPFEVNAALETAVFNGSLAFKTQRWRSVVTVIEVAKHWWTLSDAEREAAWTDPWAWRDLLAEVPGKTTAATVAELRYLAHPGVFPAIVSSDHRRKIRDAFARTAGVTVTKDVERDLYEITTALQAERGEPLWWYRDPDLSQKWLDPVAEPVSTGATTTPSGDGITVERRAWLVRGSSVRGRNMIPLWRESGIVSLAASHLPPLPADADEDQIASAVASGYATSSYAQREEKQRDVVAFVRSVRAGDVVVTTSNSELFLGTVTGDHEQVQSTDGRSNLRRTVDWAGEAVAYDDIPGPLMGRLTAGADVTDLTELLDDVARLLAQASGAEEEVIPADSPVIFSLLTADQVDALLVGREWLDEFVDLLNDKRQVILHGPPGTGKTFLAQQVARAVAPRENVKLVQFHPAYSYEDFFEGYRPADLGGGQAGFKLKAGPFRRIVENARQHPDQPFVLIVDEINRANLAKVFGELYYLLEYRDDAIDLLYSDDTTTPFSLPTNVFIVGTMNTADRSIALVDAAMRRRFAFLSLHPGDAHLRSVLPRWLERENLPTEAAELLTALNETFGSRDLAVGPSYFMKQTVKDDAGLRRIWRTEILPLLTEHHIGEGVDVEAKYGLDALRRKVQSARAREAAATGEVGPDVSDTP